MSYPRNNEGYNLAKESPTTYARDLTSFSLLGNEKLGIAKYVISQGLVGDALDIGAGSGEVARHLLDKSDRYVAIEQNPDLCVELGRLGVEVVNGTFPGISAEGDFDTVLASHSIPSRREEYEPFIDAALERTKKFGKLVIVALSDTPSAYSTVMGEIGLPRTATGGYVRGLSDYARTKGRVLEQAVVNSVNATDIEGVISAIAFVGSTNGNIEKRDFITAALQDRRSLLSPYYTKEGYSFPFVSHGVTIMKE